MTSTGNGRRQNRDRAVRQDEQRTDSLRIPPHSLEAEQAVLGGLMLSTQAWDTVADRLREEDFYRRDHQLIFRAIARLAEENRPCDAVTLGEWLENQGLAEELGGGAYILELASTTPSAANVAAYADIVREKSILRQLIDVGTAIASDGFQPEGRSSRDLLESAEQQVFRIAEAGSRSRQGFQPLRDAVKDAFRVLQERYTNKAAGNGAADRIHRFRPADCWSAAFGLDHSCGTTRDGENLAGAQYRRVRGDQVWSRSGRFLDGDVGVSVGVSP
jgi:replicative DNA helicase